MKIVICIVTFCLIFMVTNVFGQPFLVCDPSTPESEVASYILSFNGEAEIETPAPLYYDLTNIATGSYTVTAKAKNLWGVSDSASLDFHNSFPSKPVNIEISIQ